MTASSLTELVRRWEEAHAESPSDAVQEGYWVALQRPDPKSLPELIALTPDVPDLLGVALFRAGRYEAALRRLRVRDSSFTKLYRALAEAARGRQEAHQPHRPALDRPPRPHPPAPRGGGRPRAAA